MNLNPKAAAAIVTIILLTAPAAAQVDLIYQILGDGNDHTYHTGGQGYIDSDGYAHWYISSYNNTTSKYNKTHVWEDATGWRNNTIEPPEKYTHATGTGFNNGTDILIAISSESSAGSNIYRREYTAGPGDWDNTTMQQDYFTGMDWDENTDTAYAAGKDLYNTTDGETFNIETTGYPLYQSSIACNETGGVYWIQMEDDNPDLAIQIENNTDGTWYQLPNITDSWEYNGEIKADITWWNQSVNSSYQCVVAYIDDTAALAVQYWTGNTWIKQTVETSEGRQFPRIDTDKCGRIHIVTANGIKGDIEHYWLDPGNPTVTGWQYESVPHTQNSWVASYDENYLEIMIDNQWQKEDNALHIMYINQTIDEPLTGEAFATEIDIEPCYREPEPEPDDGIECECESRPDFFDENNTIEVWFGNCTTLKHKVVYSHALITVFLIALMLFFTWLAEEHRSFAYHLFAGVMALGLGASLYNSEFACLGSPATGIIFMYGMWVFALYQFLRCAIVVAFQPQRVTEESTR